MSPALRYRLFGIGKMPPLLKQAAAGSDVLVAAEGVSVRETVEALKMPRASVGHGSKLIVGSVVVLPDRLLAAVGQHVILDTGFKPVDGADQTLAVAPDGLRISFDVAAVLEHGSGSAEVHYRLPLEETVLARLPVTTCPVSLCNAQPALLKGWQGSRSR